ncbi:MAG: response regulator transcription factor [Candidatus Hodarchaeales archaeon]
MTGFSQPHKTSILIVEDEDDLRFLYSLAFKIKDGYEVAGTARNGLEAIEFLEQCCASNNLPDVILIDHRMPVMDGLTAIQKIRKKYDQAMFIILATADQHAIQLAKKNKMKIDGFLQKPFELKLIRETIENLTRNELIKSKNNES